MGYFLSEQSIDQRAKLNAACQSLLGTNTPIGAPFINPILSTKYWDDDTKLSYYGYRYYSPGVGRWLNRDPQRGYIYLVYSFVENNINNIDYLGLWAWGFKIRNLGEHAIEEMPGYNEPTKMFKLYGLTTVTKNEIQIYPRYDNKYVYFDFSAEKDVEFWWHVVPTYYHEMGHVKIHHDNWFELADALRPYVDIPICRGKAQIAADLFNLLIQYHNTVDNNEQYNYDCTAYGDQWGACTLAAASKEDLPVIFQRVEDKGSFRITVGC